MNLFLLSLLKILFILFIALFYVFYGIKLLGDVNLNNRTLNNIDVKIFMAAYGLLGLTLLNCLLTAKYWEVLSKKRGPPGMMGPRGDDGEEGFGGVCTNDYNILYALLKIKKNVGNLVVDNGNLLLLDLKNSENINHHNRFNKIKNKLSNSENVIKLENVYNRENNKLKNATFDRLINRIVSSKEFTTLLFQPDDENSDNISYGKTLDELIEYLGNIINLWAYEILKRNNGIEFFITIDQNLSSSNQIKFYVNNVIKKYDIFYWGSRKPFRPLEIEVMRQTQISEDYDNTAFPVDDKPAIDIIELEFSDLNTKDLIWLWNTEGMPDTKQNYRDWKKHGNGLYSQFILPEIYLPKVQTRGKKKYYPISCVMLEGDPDSKTRRKRKTYLVSGDVVIPDRFTFLWKDRKQKSSIYGDGYRSDGKNAGVFWRLESSNKDYVTLGDFFWSHTTVRKGQKVDSFTDYDENWRLLKLFLKINDPQKYIGIVALPKSYLKVVSGEKNPIFSYSFVDEKVKYYRTAYFIDIFTNKRIEDPQCALKMRNPNHKNRPGDLSLYYGPDKVYRYSDKFYIINKDKLIPKNEPLKDIEIENNDLGFGYYGYPHLSDPKYSIFSFLGFVPEGMIINYNNNRKLYIRHYGGSEMNRYNIFKYNHETGNFDKALKVSRPNKIEFAILKPADVRFGFRYELDSNNNKLFRLKSRKFPNVGYLNYIVNITNTNYDNASDIRPGGVTIDHTNSIFKLEPGKGPSNDTNSKLFMLIPATGMNFTNKPMRINLNKNKYPGSNLTYT